VRWKKWDKGGLEGLFEYKLSSGGASRPSYLCNIYIYIYAGAFVWAIYCSGYL